MQFSFSILLLYSVDEYVNLQGKNFYRQHKIQKTKLKHHGDDMNIRLHFCSVRSRLWRVPETNGGGDMDIEGEWNKGRFIIWGGGEHRDGWALSG